MALGQCQWYTQCFHSVETSNGLPSKLQHFTTCLPLPALLFLTLTPSHHMYPITEYSSRSRHWTGPLCSQGSQPSLKLGSIFPLWVSSTATTICFSFISILWNLSFYKITVIFFCFLEINSWMVMMFLFTSSSAHSQLIDGIIQKWINILKGMCVRRRTCGMWFKISTPSQKHSIILNLSGTNWCNIAEIPERDYNNFTKHMMAAASVYCCYHKSQMKWFSCVNILHIHYFL